jgi:hypothetical protein
MTEQYAILHQPAGHLVNVVLWDGDLSKWQPPAGTSAARLADIDLATLPPAPAPKAEPITAEEWVSQQKFDGNRPTTLLYLKLQLDAAQKTSAKLAAVQGWLDGMIVAGVTSPDEKRSDYPAAPFSFEAASQEALTVLAG